MRINLILVACIFTVVSTSGQTLLSEDFSSGSMPPSGWSISAYSSQWAINSGNQAGGSSPEAKFTYVSANSVSRLTTPYINTSGYSNLVVEFKHYVDHYASGYTLGVATRAADGTWHNVWTISPSSSIGPETKTILINNSDVGSSTFQFCLYISGNFYNIDYWYIDDISLTPTYNLDASLVKISTPDIVSDFAQVKGTIINKGLTSINSLVINWQVDDEEIVTTNFTGIYIPFGFTYNFTCSGQIHKPVGLHNLKVWIEQVNGTTDEFEDNNLLEKTISIASYATPKKPCFEEFTSSTCPPCATFNYSFVPWCSTHENNITLIKYQMNWPGSGDPYYTAEGGTRRTYYGVSFVPWLNLNGNQIDTDISSVQSGYNVAINENSPASIVSSFTQSGKEMNINTTILPFSDFSNCRIHVIVFENQTTGNVGSNGETEFHHVMMKMVPNANGTSVNLTDRIPCTLNQSVNLTGTFVEDFNDLGVIIIFQNYSTKEIYQSAYSLKNASFASIASLSNLTVDGTTIPGFSPGIYNYDVELPFGTEDIPVVGATPVDADATPVILQTFELPGTTTVQVFAENLQTYLTYSVNFTVSDTYYLDAGILLEGPYNESQMNTSLNQQGLIPLNQPFNQPPWNYSGTESVGSIPNGNIVDWILVELRDANSPATANGLTTLTRKAGFLLTNGQIVNLDGSSPLNFSSLFNINLYLVIWHRNHLGVLSNYALQANEGVFSYYFTDDSGKFYGSSDGYVELSPNIFGMADGDLDHNKNVEQTDKTDFWENEAGKSGYLSSDANMDGQVDNDDKNLILLPNVGKWSQVPL